MENRFSKLQADLEVNEERVSKRLPPSPGASFFELIHNSSFCRSICARLHVSLEVARNWAAGTASTANGSRNLKHARQRTKAEDKEEGTDSIQVRKEKKIWIGSESTPCISLQEGRHRQHTGEGLLFLPCQVFFNKIKMPVVLS
eukprot:scaffold149836_cov17-Tisochrysis_lutea.AAC.3